MTGFAAEWLRLREPADHAARNGSVRDVVVKYLNQTDGAVIADLAAGTGSTVRAMQAAIEVDQHWHLMDCDETLLEQASGLLSGSGFPDSNRAEMSLQTHQVDLNRFPSGLTAIKPNLITTSAFVDLVSVDWLSRLVTYALMERVPVYTALTYCGAISFSTNDAADAAIIDAFNQHQLNDKGFGPALGPFAADRITKLFKVARFHTIEKESDWKLGADMADLQKEFLKGLAQAATETKAISGDDVDGWLARRLELVENGQSQIVIGHKDVAAFPK